MASNKIWEKINAACPGVIGMKDLMIEDLAMGDVIIDTNGDGDHFWRGMVTGFVVGYGGVHDPLRVVVTGYMINGNLMKATKTLLLKGKRKLIGDFSILKAYADALWEKRISSNRQGSKTVVREVYWECEEGSFVKIDGYGAGKCGSADGELFVAPALKSTCTYLDKRWSGGNWEKWRALGLCPEAGNYVLFWKILEPEDDDFFLHERDNAPPLAMDRHDRGLTGNWTGKLGASYALGREYYMPNAMVCAGPMGAVKGYSSGNVLCGIYVGGIWAHKDYVKNAHCVGNTFVDDGVFFAERGVLVGIYQVTGIFDTYESGTEIQLELECGEDVYSLLGE